MNLSPASRLRYQILEEMSLSPRGQAMASYNVAPARRVLETLHYVVPIVVAIFYIATTVWSVCTLQILDKQPNSKLRKVVISFLVVVALTFVFEAISIVPSIFSSKISPFADTDSNIYALSGFLLWVIVSTALLNTDGNVWYPYCGAWLLALTGDLVVSGLTASLASPTTVCEWIQVTLRMIRASTLVLLTALFVALRRSSERGSDEEVEPLLPKDQRAKKQIEPRSYQVSATTAPDESAATASNESEIERQERVEAAKVARLVDHLKEHGNWFSYIKSYAMFLPLIYPKGKPLLQFYLVVIGGCVLAERALHPAIPYSLGLLTNSLGTGDGPAIFKALVLYSVLKWLKSYSGIEGLRQFCWLHVESYAVRTLETASYDHIMELSCDFHDHKQSNELYAVIGQGSSIINLLQVIIYEIGPMIVDLFIACFYFYFLFNAYLVLIGIAVIALYTWTDIHMAQIQAAPRRKSKIIFGHKNQVLSDTICGWRTVCYFNQISHAQKTYATSVRLAHKSARVISRYYFFGYGLQSVIVNTGGICAFGLAAYQVVYGGKDVGTFITLITYWANFTGMFPYMVSLSGRLLRQLFDAEESLLLFQTKPSVPNGPHAACITRGDVEFEDVSFSYDEKKTDVNGFSFWTNGGQRIALIGETGAGKSTILKLLFRLYDVTKGSIKIDGQDIRGMTLSSLREHIGVVPQDPLLFNDTIMANVRYAKLDATDEEVMEACRKAAVHEKIMTFTDKYLTIVGEKGVRLSGGELQRIAIARAILKDPKIILLDEATSNVDSETEAKIQEGLEELTHGKTTFIVAHRLSTVKDADVVLVIKDGAISEQGHPKDLLKSRGKYYRGWTKQLEIEDNAGDSASNSSPMSKGQSDKTGSDSNQRRRISRNDSRLRESSTGFSGTTPDTFEVDLDTEPADLARQTDGPADLETTQKKASKPGSRKNSQHRRSRADKKQFRPEAPEFVPSSQGIERDGNLNLGRSKSIDTHPKVNQLLTESPYQGNNDTTAGGAAVEGSFKQKAKAKGFSKSKNFATRSREQLSGRSTSTGRGRGGFETSPGQRVALPTRSNYMPASVSNPEIESPDK